MYVLSLKKALAQLQIKETVLILAMSVILPFLVHLVPPISGIPLGARLLPMFYAPFIAVVLFRAHVAIVTALLSPALNSLLTGYPIPEKIFLLTFELVLFCVIAFLIRRKTTNFWGTAPLAYLITVFCVDCLLGWLNSFVSTIVNSFWGIGILLLINVLLRRFSISE